MASCIAWVRSRTCRRLSATCSSPTAKASKGTNSLIRRATEPRSAWPELAYKSWQDTCATLHLWTQVVGKIRLALTPLMNHWWNVTLYVTARGLTTNAMPYRGRMLQIDFDFIAHELVVRASDGRERRIPLAPMTTADFYAAVMTELRALDADVRIWTMPSEIPDAIPFDQDRTH